MDGYGNTVMCPHLDSISSIEKAINVAVLDCHGLYLQKVVGIHYQHIDSATVDYHHISAYMSRH